MLNHHRQRDAPRFGLVAVPRGVTSYSWCLLPFLVNEVSLVTNLCIILDLLVYSGKLRVTIVLRCLLMNWPIKLLWWNASSNSSRKWASATTRYRTKNGGALKNSSGLLWMPPHSRSYPHRCKWSLAAHSLLQIPLSRDGTKIHYALALLQTLRVACSTMNM
jgi:hypothetical protein